MQMGERKLAYIAEIGRIDPIPGKDRIVYASLKNLGWQVITDVSHKVGDKVVYIEIDSVLPVKPEYEFLRKRCFSAKRYGFVIGGMRMAGLVSYGLVLPVPSGYEDKSDGFDMTEVLEIRKREDESSVIPPVPETLFEKIANRVFRILGIKRQVKVPGISGGWLSFANKTDETRIENLDYLFNDEFQGTPVYATVKCDGQSATFAVYQNWFFMASRNVVLYRSPLKRAMRELNPKREHPAMDNFRKIAARYNIPAQLAKTRTDAKDSIVVQGELCGPGIQKNPLDLSETDMFVFNVYRPKAEAGQGDYFSWDALNAFCTAQKLKTVPFIERRKFDWPDKAALKEYAKGRYPNGKNREGVVIRYDADREPIPEALPGMTNMWSFKVINDDYILGK
jgi:RNA ligase (TIGR02306 family)